MNAALRVKLFLFCRRLQGTAVDTRYHHEIAYKKQGFCTAVLVQRGPATLDQSVCLFVYMHVRVPSTEQDLLKDQD